MDGSDRMVRRKSLTERLGLKGIGCCGTIWGIGPDNISVRDDEEEESLQEVHINESNVRPTTPICETPTRSTMNLAAALAAERQFRAAQDMEVMVSISPTPIRPEDGTPGTPYRVSLMRLLEETEACDEKEEVKKDGLGCDSMCCVCMVRKKGAAFIPCGHTFCRVCSRELWLNRGSCPLCNRSIVEILDIF